MDELLLIFLSLACSACIGAPAFLLCRPFADLRGRRWQKALMLVGLGYMGSLPIWVGDKLFFRLLEDPDSPFFSLKLSYRGDTLVQAVLDGKELAL